VLVVALDACRADKIGAYGFERETTPVLDALAASGDSTLFRGHHVQATWTKPSTASLFTGQWVHDHGVVAGEGAPSTREKAFRTQVLPASATTLAERLHAAGIATVGVVKSVHLAPKEGFAQGFDRYELMRKASDVERVDRLLEMIAAAPPRFFAYAHLMGCHNPFPPRDRDPEYLARYGTRYDEDARRAAGVDFRRASIKFAIRDGKVRLEPADIEFLHRIYEAKLRQTDRHSVARLLDGLRRIGRYDDTLVFVTADHGEALWDHPGTYSHNGVLFEEVLHVPLIVKFPAGRRPAKLGASVDGLSRSIDLAPTILAWLAIGLPEMELPGRNLFAEEAPRFALAEDEAAFALLEGGEKLLSTASGDRLFDLVADPAESRDLAAERSRRVTELLDRAAALRGRRGPTLTGGAIVEEPLDPETLEELRSLGYVQ
jgi:arylsulfatase A-like enzyme